MVRRSLGVALWGVVGLLAVFLGALSALIGTGAGRTLVARAAEGALRQVFTGTIEIGDVGGTLLTGLTLSDVRLFDPDTTLVAWLPRAELSRSEEHTSELQSQSNLVCRLLLEKKKNINRHARFFETDIPPTLILLGVLTLLLTEYISC